MNVTRAQQKIANAAHLAAVSRQLDALDLDDAIAVDYGDPSPAGAVRTTSFVNRHQRPETHLETLVRHVRQGIGGRLTASETGRSTGALLVRGTTLQTKTKTPTKPKVKSSPIAHRERLTSNGSTYAATKIKRQRVDDETVANAWSAMPADRPKWAVTIRMTAQRQSAALRQEEPLDWLRRSANRELSKVLGSTPSAIWSLGIASKGGPQPHLHAVLSAPVEAIPAVYRALRVVGGHKPRPISWNGWSTPTTRQRGHGDMVDIRPARDSGAAQYVLGNSLESYGRIHGRTIVVSNDLRQISSTKRRTQIDRR